MLPGCAAKPMAEITHGLGHCIRYRFGLWDGNQKPMDSCARSALRDALYPAEASEVIIALLALELEKTHRLRPV
jgi:hypothetical protein